MCPRCGRRIMPFSAEKCFEDHLRPEDLERWTVWICPEDHEMVVPDDMNRDEILDVNQNHPLIHHRWPILLPGDLPGSPQSPPWVRGRPGGARPRIPAEGAGLHPPADPDPIVTPDHLLRILAFPSTNPP